jgi:hypothetical protein
MKIIILSLLAFIFVQQLIAQDTVVTNQDANMNAKSIIITKKIAINTIDSTQKMSIKKHTKNKSVNFFVLDIGYAGFRDYTHYNNPETQAFLHNAGGIPLNEGDFSIKHARISNFNLWFFLQTQNLYKQIIRLKYGFGIETNNYYYKSPITYVEGGNPYVIRDNAHFSLNKLATDYFTAPLYLQINTTPNSATKGLKIAVGASVGYLYNARQKQISDERGMQKNKTDFNISPFKLSYIAEVGLGKIKFYGSLAATALHKNALNQLPFTVGVRLSAAD